MSHIRVKTKYVENNSQSIVEKTLYADHNLSCDMVDFYDENGECILSIPDAIDNNLLDAINRLYKPTLNEFGIERLQENVNYMSLSEINKCKG
jgi:hypothetical protein